MFCRVDVVDVGEQPLGVLVIVLEANVNVHFTSGLTS
ncbi:hypothetical protein HRbin20_01025 [bacterium HR20]|nr:hypothetical protein HRbin20_01025 [bacterium HR20]